MFVDAEDNLLRYIVYTLGNESILFIITRVDWHHSIIDALAYQRVFSDTVIRAPDWFGGSVFEHITRDVWRVNGEYHRKIMAPEGFWADAFLCEFFAG